MRDLTIEEIDKIAIKFITLRDKANDTNNETDVLRFEAYKNIAAAKLKCLVLKHTKRYKQFANYLDLEQDGFEALMHALGTFRPDKGNFVWWGNRYIKTRISRKANAHSTIKYPIKKAKELKPYKISTIPVRADTGLTPYEEFEKTQKAKHIENAMENLTEEQRIVVSMKYGFNGIRERPVGKILEELSISRQQYSKLLSDAESQIKKYLLRVEQS